LNGDISGSFSLGLERTPPLTLVGPGIFSAAGLVASSREIAGGEFSFELRWPANVFGFGFGSEGAGLALAAEWVAVTPV
jgi:hypothetical protein